MKKRWSFGIIASTHKDVWPRTGLMSALDEISANCEEVKDARPQRLTAFAILFTHERIMYDGITSLRRGYGPIIFLLALLFGKKLAVFWHETAWNVERNASLNLFQDPRHTLKALVVRLALRSKSVFHVCDSASAAGYFRNMWDREGDSVAWQHPCTEARRVLAFPLPSPICRGLFVTGGGVSYRKGVDRFIEVAERVVAHRPEARFVWIGKLGATGPSWQSITQLLEEKNITQNVVFLGHLSDPTSYYYEAEAIILLSRDEPAPKLLQEGLGLGKRCVAFNVGGISEVLGDQGVLVDSGDVDSFAQVLISDPFGESTLEVQRRRRARFEAYFTESAYAQRFIRVLERWEKSDCGRRRC